MSERTGRPAAMSANCMIAAPHSLASAAGLAVLHEGGSAIDAIIAANAVMTVIYPDQTSIGGDCWMIAWDAKTRSMHGFNGSGRSPRRIDRERLRAQYGEMPRAGIHTVTVPGTIDAWSQAHDRFGRLPLARLLQPAIALARDGFPVSRNLTASAEAVVGNPAFGDAFQQVYFSDGKPPRPASRMRLPALAGTLEAVASGGRDVFYTGPIAEEIVRVSDSLGGTLTMDDLASHRGEWVEPVTSTYRGATLAELPPNSQGITALVELNLAELQPAHPFGSAESIHVQVEAKKQAFAVRDQLLTDPAFRQVDVDRLVSKAFAAELGAQFDPGHASAGNPTLVGDTVYLCAVDRDGNAVSLIQSIYLGFGSGVVAGSTGVMLQSRGAYFSLEDDHPNRLEGGKRTLHTLMPGMLLKDGDLWGPIGTQGGDAQAQVHLQLVVNLVDHGMDPQEAIDAPRWVAGGRPGTDPLLVGLENRFSREAFDGLAARGHHPEWTVPFDIHYGQAQMILRDPESGVLLGGADPRADGVAIGI